MMQENQQKAMQQQMEQQQQMQQQQQQQQQMQMQQMMMNSTKVCAYLEGHVTSYYSLLTKLGEFLGNRSLGHIFYCQKINFTFVFKMFLNQFKRQFGYAESKHGRYPKYIFMS